MSQNRMSVIEIGPGIQPSVFAFDPQVNYLAVDPDMGYEMNYIKHDFYRRMENVRGTLDNFQYVIGRTIGEVLHRPQLAGLHEVTGMYDAAFMSNVLGFERGYRGSYSGYYVGEDGETLQSDIREPGQLIAQGLALLRPTGMLVVVEDAIDKSTGLPDHVMPQVFEGMATAIGGLKAVIHTGADYSKKAAHYFRNYSAQEPSPGYFDTCFVAELTM